MHPETQQNKLKHQTEIHSHIESDSIYAMHNDF